jgi:hypothetical protein
MYYYGLYILQKSSVMNAGFFIGIKSYHIVYQSTATVPSITTRLLRHYAAISSSMNGAVTA